MTNNSFNYVNIGNISCCCWKNDRFFVGVFSLDGTCQIKWEIAREFHRIYFCVRNSNPQVNIIMNYKRVVREILNSFLIPIIPEPENLKRLLPTQMKNRNI